MKDLSRKPDGPRPLRVVEREPFNNPQAEAVVLGTLIDFPERMDEVADQLAPEDFYTSRHHITYEVMLDYYREHGHGADFLTLCDLLDQRDDLSASDLVEFSHLRHEMWSADLAQDVKLILGPAWQRKIWFASQQLADIALRYPDPDQSREATEKLLYDLTMDHAPVSDFESIASILQWRSIQIENAWKKRGKLLGVPTGFDDLNTMTDGWQKANYIILGGRPSIGKTALALSMGYHAASRGYAVAAFSLEMSKEELSDRLVSMLSGIPSNYLRSGWINGEKEWSRVVKAEDHLSELPLYIDDTAGSPLTSIRSKLRRLKAKIGRSLDLVIVDYLGLIEEENESAARRENRNQEISKISRGLKKIARDFNVPLLALAQLNREVEGRNNKVPQLSDLRDSGSLEQDADVVMFVYRDEVYNPESERKGYADVIIAKHRNGPRGTVSLRFNGALASFSDPGQTPEDSDAER